MASERRDVAGSRCPPRYVPEDDSPELGSSDFPAVASVAVGLIWFVLAGIVAVPLVIAAVFLDPVYLVWLGGYALIWGGAFAAAAHRVTRRRLTAPYLVCCGLLILLTLVFVASPLGGFLGLFGIPGLDIVLLCAVATFILATELRFRDLSARRAAMAAS